MTQKQTLPPSPQQARLETVPSPDRISPWVVRFTCPEFTTLCPRTGQPDFAVIVLDYIPDALILESKSLKLFLASFRNHRAFHEACTMLIARRVEQEVKPVWLRVGGYWYPRGGIPIDIFYQSKAPPAGVWLPPEHPPYRGR